MRKVEASYGTKRALYIVLMLVVFSSVICGAQLYFRSSSSFVITSEVENLPLKQGSPVLIRVSLRDIAPYSISIKYAHAQTPNSGAFSISVKNSRGDYVSELPSVFSEQSSLMSGDSHQITLHHNEKFDEEIDLSQVFSLPPDRYSLEVALRRSPYVGTAYVFSAPRGTNGITTFQVIP